MELKVIRTQNNSRNCIICGMENNLGLKAPFYNLEDNSVASVFEFKSEHQSYPDRTHGGMVSALLDELMGRALWTIEPDCFGVTTTLSITYRKPVPLNTKVKARAVITFNSMRGFTAKGAVYDLNDNLLIQGEAKYFKIPFSKLFGIGTSQHEEMCYEIPLNITQLNFPEL